jgi:hypothetical protein
MKRSLLLLTLLVSNLLGADPVVTMRVDLKARRDGFYIDAYQAEQTTVRVYLYNDGAVWNGATNYSGVLGFGTAYGDSTSMVMSSNTFTSATNYLDFSFTDSQLNTNGSFYAQLMITNTAGGKWVFDEGRINIKKSPISGGATAQVFLTPVNWDLVINEGTVPWGTSGTMDHTALSNLAWTDSGHTGTAGRVAIFSEGGAAGYAGFGAGAYLDNDDNISVSNDIISGAALGATAVQPATLAGYVATNDTTYTQTVALAGSAVQRAGDTMTGDLSMGGQSVTNVSKIYGTALSVDIANRRLYDNTGEGIILDWQNRTLAGSWTIGANWNGQGVASFTNMASQEAGSSNATLATTQYVMDTLAITPSGISASTATNITRDAFSEAYTITAADGTATVARTFSDLYYNSFVTLATGATVLTIDTSTFPTNGDSAFSWTINPNGQTISVNGTAIDTNSWNDLTLTTNAYNKLIFERAPYETIFYVWGRP